MLGCQLPQTHLSLIAHTWPVFDPSRSCTPCEPPAQLTNKLVWARWIDSLNIICNVEKVERRNMSILYEIQEPTDCGTGKEASAMNN